MIKIKELEDHCKKHLIQYEVDEGEIIVINDKEYQVVDEDSVLFDPEFNFLPQSEFLVDGYVYQFGGRWYIQDDGEEVSLTELLNVGEVNQKIPTNAFLGIHSGMELLNGVGLYKDWIKKAKFLGTKTLGICEKGSLRGAISFQEQCKKNDIKPIFGLTIPVAHGMQSYEVKAYAKDFQGWQNLLKFSSILNVEESLTVDQSILEKYSEGLFLIIDPKYTTFSQKPDFIDSYQLDTVIFEDSDTDMGYILNLEKYLTSDLNPVAICDAYYPEQNDWEVREKLWGIAKSFDYRTKNQYFKNSDQYAKEIISLFENGNKSWIKLYKTAMSNLNKIIEGCNFEYDTTSRHLPKYKMTHSQSKKFKSNEELFIHLIKKGFKDRDIQNAPKYIDRLKEEIDVLKSGDVIDYFLVLYDIIQYAKSQSILIGIGRGSAGGSLVSYLLDIIQVDPIEFDLLFSRFLNKGRMGSFEDCKAFEIETSEGLIKLNEKSLLRILRDSKEIPTFVEDLKKGDIILKY